MKDEKMELFSLNTLLIVLLYAPGYIFIQTVDYFLLKREKSQFEKTIQGLLASAVIFVVFILCDFQILNTEKKAIINLFLLKIKHPENVYIIPVIIEKFKYLGIFFLLLCLYSFVLACIYSIIRKTAFVSNIIQKITQRDYFQSVGLRFYSEAMNKVVIITMNNESKYLGSLIGAPDHENDKKIIIYDPYVIENAKLVKLRSDRLLIDTNNVRLLEVVFEEEEKCQTKKKLKTSV
ncbi:hypothetical protein H0R92_04455 [Treponema sp. OMZ 840]|uniref:DUF6338 family protein n=1 Tax=Treponema sp. OMZ 840 TaxID=244313 RepID=UPI003D8BA9A1